MRRYIILSITRTVGLVIHRYDAQRAGVQLTGMYVCPTLNDTKIVSDFICMSNTYINSVSVGGLTYAVGENTAQGRISGFKPNNADMEVLLNGARTNSIPIAQVRKIAAVVTTAAAPVAVTPVGRPSRSQVNADITSLETRISGERDIRLAATMKASIPTTVGEFLIRFFKKDNEEKNTIYVDNKEVYTTPGRRRSLGDIYKICKYYFPNTTLQEILTQLYTTLPTTLTGGFRTSYCSTIRKRVFYYEAGSGNTVANSGTNDEYGYTTDWYTSKI